MVIDKPCCSSYCLIKIRGYAPGYFYMLNSLQGTEQWKRLSNKTSLKMILVNLRVPMYQGRHKVGKSGEARSTVVGIICPPG